MSFLEEIKRRKIFQVAAVYGIVAWLLVQIVATVEAPLNLPEWFDTAIIVLLAIGFPITLIISWAFNVTADGIVRDAGSGETRSAGSRGIEYVLIGLLGVAVAWLFYRDLDDRMDMPIVASSAVPDSIVAATAAPEAANDTMPNSIAVLLCDNFSTDPENDFFAASLHEEMLNQLFKLRNLNVIARTSVLQYSVTSTQRPPIPQIANELGVRTVMECSVAYGDGRIVISVQLIDGTSGVHVWSERYNRAFEDVFGIQADIAMNVANALAVEFSVEEQQAIERTPTDSPEAYALYLQALSQLNMDNAATLDLLERALAFDPNFATAHFYKAGLHAAALVNTTGLNAVSEADRAEQIALADFHAARALELDPSARSWGPLISRYLTWRWSDSLRQLADTPDPIDSASIWFLTYAGQNETAIARARRAVELDPRNMNATLALSVSLAYARQFDDAADIQQTAVAQAPNVPLLHSWLAYIEIARGNADIAARELSIVEQLLGANRSFVFLPELAYAYARIERRDDAERVIQEMTQSDSDIEIGTGGEAMVALARGDRAAAITHFEAAIAKIERHELDEGYFNLMNLKMNYMADPVLEEAPFVTLRNRLQGD